MSIYWIILLIAVGTEVTWALTLKAIDTNPSVATIGLAAVLTVLNMALLSFAMRGISVGTAYAVWTGLGAVGVAIAGVILHGDPLTLKRMVFLGIIVFGVIGLKMVGNEG